MDKNSHLVIAGGGLAAARAIKAYREAGGASRITLVAEERSLPYHRPALSKKYLRGETKETPYVEDEAFYREHDIDVLLGSRLTAVDPTRRTVALDNGSRLGYEQLLLATGARPRRLDVPGADLDGVFTLRTVDDSATIRDAAAAAERAIVVGGGFIGMESAASLRALGVDVTLVHTGPGLFDSIAPPELSAELAALYRERGLDLVLEDQVVALRGSGAVREVQTAGGRVLDADLVVVGVGVVPNDDFLAGSGLEARNGVVVDASFATAAPGVHAVGDVARFFDPLYQRHRRIEHWSNASYQGTEVGKILAGADGGYDTVSSFFTEVFGTTIKVFGDVSRFDALRAEGSLADGFVATYKSRDRLVGAVAVGQEDENEAALKELIGETARGVPAAA